MIDVEDINEIPEKFRADYVEVTEGDKTIWKNKAFVALKEVNEKLKGKYSSASEKASAYDKLQEELAAKAEKDEQDRIKGLHDKSDHKSLYEELKQKYADLEKRSGETQAEYKQRVDDLNNEMGSSKVDSLINEMSELFTDAGKKTAKRLLSGQVKFDADSKSYKFLDEDGGVTSLDKNGFKSYVENSDTYAPLLKAKISVGGFGRNAMKGAGGADQNSNLSPVERINRARSKQS